MPFSKVVTFTLKTLEFSRKLSILLQFKTKFRLVTKSKWGTVQNIKFSIEVHSRLVFLLKKLVFMEIMKLVENIKFSSRIPSRSVIFTEKFPIFMFSSRILSRALIFIEKFPIFMKIKKNTKNTKFSYVMHYRAVIFIAKLQFS